MAGNMENPQLRSFSAGTFGMEALCFRGQRSVAVAEDTGNTEDETVPAKEADNEKETYTWNPAIAIIIGICILLLASGAVIYVKKKNGSIEK